MADTNSKPKSTMLRLRAPLAQGMKTLDRSLFSSTFNLAAASIRDNRNISRYKTALFKEQRALERGLLDSLRMHPDGELAGKGRKCVLLKPGVKVELSDTWGPTLQAGVKAEEVDMIPYELTLGYEAWTYEEVIKSILPEDLFDEIPSNFNSAGHVIHLNLRDRYLPYKSIIAQILLDKNTHHRTVINKVDDVGNASEFRTFAYEILAGPDDMLVEQKENDCIFKFDYSKVYWNSRLRGEHERLVDMFKPGEVVADVMAGIGPFAVPAGKKGVFVWANDMNPESFRYMKDAIARNRPFNEDGRTFIHHVADLVHEASTNDFHALIYPKFKVSRSNPQPRPPPTKVPLPPTISHFVMNLPGSATTFLRHFKGLYAGKESLFAPHTETKLPMVHVHCFGAKNAEMLPSEWPGAKMSEDEVEADIFQRVFDEIGVRFKAGDPEKDGEAELYDVRDVAPNKRMFCVCFRVPPRVAFAPRS